VGKSRDIQFNGEAAGVEVQLQERAEIFSSMEKRLGQRYSVQWRSGWGWG